MNTSTLPVVAPSDPDHAADVAGYNRIVTHRPRLVVGARTASDVVAAVRYAADAGLTVGSRRPATVSASRPTGCW